MRLRNIIASGGLAAAVNLLVILAAGKLLGDSSTTDFFNVLTLAIVLLPIVEFGIVEYLIHKRAFPSTYLLIQSLLILGGVVYISSVLGNGSFGEVFVVLLYVYSLLANRFVFGLGQMTSTMSLVFLGQLIPQATKVAALALILIGIDIVHAFSIVAILNLFSLYLIKQSPIKYDHEPNPLKSPLLIFGATSLVILILQRFDLIVAQANLTDDEFNAYFLLSNVIIGVQIFTRSMLTKNLADLATPEIDRYESIKLVVARQQGMAPLAIVIILVAALVPAEVLSTLFSVSNPNIKLCMIALLSIQMVGLVLSPLEAIFIRYKPTILLYQKGTAAAFYVFGFMAFSFYSSFGLVAVAVIAFVARLFAWALLVLFVVKFLKNSGMALSKSTK